MIENVRLPFMSVPDSLLVEQHNRTHISSVTHVQQDYLQYFLERCCFILLSQWHQLFELKAFPHLSREQTKMSYIFFIFIVSMRLFLRNTINLRFKGLPRCYGSYNRFYFLRANKMLQYFLLHMNKNACTDYINGFEFLLIQP